MVAERTTKAFRPLRGRDGKPSRRTSTKTIWWPQRDSNPRLGLERASPWVVISPTSTPGATARCHSAGSSAAGPRASAVGRSTRARDERAQDFQSCPVPLTALPDPPPSDTLPPGLHRHQGTPPVLLSFFLATARKLGGLRI